MSSRTISKKFSPTPQDEGDGARVRRVIGSRQVRNLDPFLMLDHWTVQKPHGFPDHPHRGFETVKYVLEGITGHEDFKGHSGEIGPGDMQWMTAGRGIVHAEMPVTDYAEGVTIWINLSQQNKMCEPHYQEHKKDEISKAEQDGIKAVIIAGEALGIQSPLVTRTPCHFIDYNIPAGAVLTHQMDADWNCFIYVLQGQVKILDDNVFQQEAAIFNNDSNQVVIEAVEDAKLVLIGGSPLNEPIVQHGPFVMTTQQEIAEAMSDYVQGTNGFEGARQWRSVIGNLKY